MGRRHVPRRLTKSGAEGDACWFCMRGSLKKKILTERRQKQERDMLRVMRNRNSSSSSSD